MARKKKKIESAKPEWVPSKQEAAALNAHLARREKDGNIAPRIKISEGESPNLSLDHPHRKDSAVRSWLMRSVQQIYPLAGDSSNN